MPLWPDFALVHRLEDDLIPEKLNAKSLNFFYGPIVSQLGNETWSAQYYCDNKIYKKEVRNSLQLSCNGNEFHFLIEPPRDYKTFTYEQPQRVIAIGAWNGTYHLNCK